MKKATIQHISSGNTFAAEIYTTFVYLVESAREITIEQFNDHFTTVKQ